jgi:hypothetical protein
MPEERTQKYGLTRSTSKPVKLAGWDWSCAVKTLEAHHQAETTAFRSALGDFNTNIGAERDPARDALREHAQRLEAIADNLREARGALVDELVAMWPAIEDVVDEENTLRKSDTILLSDQPDPTPDPPVPIVREGLTPVQWLRVVVETVQWTREISYGCAAAALGPCYLLSKVIEYPQPQAMGLRDVAGEARDHLLHFLASRHASELRLQ